MALGRCAALRASKSCAPGRPLGAKSVKWRIGIDRCIHQPILGKLPCRLNTYKWFKRWSGRRGLNPRHSAWEVAYQLKIKDLASTAFTSDDWNAPIFSSLLQQPS